MQDDVSVDLLLIGTVTRDLIENDLNSPYRLGGTVSFAAMTALCLGRRPAILTRASSATELDDLPKEVVRYVLPSLTTTTFANVYYEDGRVQYCYTPCPLIQAIDIPAFLCSPQVVLLGPLVDEIDEDVPPLFHDDTIVAAVPQGWMRRWDENGRVYSKTWENAEKILPHLDILILSLEDIDYDQARLDEFFKHVPLVVVTEYRDGSTLYQTDEDGLLRVTKILPRPADEVDPTGAGDIFATAFVLHYQRTQDPVQAARFANVTASYSVEHEGITGVPTYDQVMAYMAEYPVAIPVDEEE